MTVGAVIIALLALLAPADAQPSSLGALLSAAPAGSAVKLPAGVFSGPLIVDKPLVLDGSAGTVIDGGRNGHCIEIRAEGVTLRDVRVQGSGLAMIQECTGILVQAPGATIERCEVVDCLFGIVVTQADGTVLRANTIAGADLDVARRGDGIKVFRSDRVLVEGNTVHDSRDLVIWFSEGAVVRGNSVANSRYGLHFMYSHNAEVEANRVDGNSVGIFLMFSNDLRLRGNVVRGSRGPSGYAIGFKDMDRAVVEGNAFVANRVGMFLDNSPQEVGVWNRIEGNLFAWNDVAIAAQPSVRRNLIRGNSFVENRQQVSVYAGGALKGNDLARDGRGNYWSDYAGFDLNHDGIGEQPHVGRDAFGHLVDRYPELRIFAYSAAEDAIDFAARALPVFQPPPSFEDPSPVLVPPEVRVGAVAQAGRGGMIALGIALVIAAVAFSAPAWLDAVTTRRTS